jgi:hypothetical protein
MDHFDDIQIEEMSSFDFAEASFDGLFEETDDDQSFSQFMNSNYEY